MPISYALNNTLRKRLAEWFETCRHNRETRRFDTRVAQRTFYESTQLLEMGT